jgi:hypothetical protein
VTSDAYLNVEINHLNLIVSLLSLLRLWGCSSLSHRFVVIFGICFELLPDT